MSSDDPYTLKMFALLGDADPYVVQEQTTDAIEKSIAGLTRERLCQPEAAGKWSILQVLQHLADTETVYGYRVRKTIAQDQPTLAGYDENLWATRLHYTEDDAQQVLAELRVLRHRNIRFLRRLSADELARWGAHAERGPESVADIVKLLAAHDLVHRRQIERIRAAITA